MMLQLSICLLAATLGQSPDSGWLESAPASADVVVRTKGLESTRDDLVAMLKAMSPNLAAQAEPALEGALAQMKGMHGAEATSQPFLLLIRAVPPKEPNQPPIAIVVKSGNYEGVLKSANGGQAPTLKAEKDGYDSFPSANGSTIYSAKNAGFVAFGSDETLVAGFAKPEGKTVAKNLSPELQKRFFGGDLGLYVNLKELNNRYAEQIAQAKQGLMAMLDQAGEQAGNASMMGMVKTMYGSIFDMAKDVDTLALSFDFAAAGLTLDGDLTVQPGSGVAKSIATTKNGDASGLAKLSADSAYYFYMNMDSKTFQGLQKLGLSMLSGNSKPSPEIEAALAKFKEMGRFETVGGASVAKGMQSFSLSTVADPKGLLALTEASIKAMKGVDSPINFFKEINVTPNAETYGGFTFTRVEMKLDMDKIKNLQPNNPASGASFVAMYGGDKISTWYGTNDKQMLQVMAPNWEKVKGMINAYSKGENAIGQSEAFKVVRSKLPQDVSILGLISAQGLINQMATQFSAITNNPNLKPPADLPKEPALLGGSLTIIAPTTFDFHLVVPSSVGPVFEKGLAPLMQGLKGQANP